jgi:dTDP-4-amino-4,6-dideoxygalactose transaminase
VEDAAEALGATYHGIRVRSFGKMGGLSFNANRSSPRRRRHAALRKKAVGEKAKFWPPSQRAVESIRGPVEVGYIYRLSNILAGIAAGSCRPGEFVDKRRYINLRYRMLLEHLPVDFEPVFPAPGPTAGSRS